MFFSIQFNINAFQITHIACFEVLEDTEVAIATQDRSQFRCNILRNFVAKC